MSKKPNHTEANRRVPTTISHHPNAFILLRLRDGRRLVTESCNTAGRQRTTGFKAAVWVVRCGFAN
ncbi:hypothetical protein L195_g012277 [Trifolium pratense]|uniref:Uncharacterized protein n=1 Tax=Trifolium pratense TaxID=57577 RepID=A0A2K3PJV9_TRIPR|nr:hypothetical protein L195_g026873 [Trifolium pratense]PNY03541.1 hypothetical protein L195_g026874 [Trifolium pratense]PNY15578.1 hypothetical protein L195_g012277 [Trifolium pratense]